MPCQPRDRGQLDYTASASPAGWGVGGPVFPSSFRVVIGAGGGGHAGLGLAPGLPPWVLPPPGCSGIPVQTWAASSPGCPVPPRNYGGAATELFADVGSRCETSRISVIQPRRLEGVQ